MFLTSAVDTARFFFVSTILLLALPQLGLPQSISSDVIGDDMIDAMDEIVVYGEPTLRLLRDEMWEAEDEFYELFNSLNDGRQFDVRCFHRRRLGTHISRRTCEPYFVKSPPTRAVPHWVFVRHKSRQMQKEMVALVDKHPELHAALVEYVDAKNTFNSSFSSRCDNKFEICRR